MDGRGFSNPDDRSSATLSKLRRYSAFFGSCADNTRATYYQKAFVDHWPPEIVLLVSTANRRDAILRGVDQWRREEGSSRSPRVHVVLFDEATAFFLGLLDGKEALLVPRKAAALPANEDMRRLMRFSGALYNEFKAVRARARAAGLSIPAYPSEIERIFFVEMLERHGVWKSDTLNSHG